MDDSSSEESSFDESAFVTSSDDNGSDSDDSDDSESQTDSRSQEDDGALLSPKSRKSKSKSKKKKSSSSGSSSSKKSSSKKESKKSSSSSSSKNKNKKKSKSLKPPSSSSNKSSSTSASTTKSSNSSSKPKKSKSLPIATIAASSGSNKKKSAQQVHVDPPPSSQNGNGITVENLMISPTRKPSKGSSSSSTTKTSKSSSTSSRSLSPVPPGPGPGPGPAAASPHTPLPPPPKPQPSGSNGSTTKSTTSSNGTSTSTSTRGSTKNRLGTTTRKKRKLQWKKAVRVNVIHNLDHYTQQEKLDSWFQPEEYTTMEDECDATSEVMDRNGSLASGFCGRGLEGWTLEGEQRKEQHVQLAIEIVWQAQLDQWRRSQDIVECWEFIRTQYLQISKPCLAISARIARQDERDIQQYMRTVRALENNRRKMLGIKNDDAGAGSAAKPPTVSRRNKIQTAASPSPRRGNLNRTVSDTFSSPRRSPRRTLSAGRSPNGGTVYLRPVLKYTGYDGSSSRNGGSDDDDDDSDDDDDDDDDNGDDDDDSRSNAKTPKTKTGRGKVGTSSLWFGPNKPNSTTPQFSRAAMFRETVLTDMKVSNSHDDDATSDDAAAAAAATAVSAGTSSRQSAATTTGKTTMTMTPTPNSNNVRKISFKPKSKTKIPTSPVGSVCSTLDSGDNAADSLRRMKSHMSVASEESTRRRMLRTAALKAL